MYTRTIWSILKSSALAGSRRGDRASSPRQPANASACVHAAGLVALLAAGCGDLLVGQHRLALGGSASARTPDGRSEPIALPPYVEVKVERSDAGYTVDLLGCSLRATRAGGTAPFVAGQRCTLTVGPQTFDVVDIRGQLDERTDTRLNLTLTAEGPKNSTGTPVHGFRLFAPAAPKTGTSG